MRTTQQLAFNNIKTISGRLLLSLTVCLVLAVLTVSASHAAEEESSTEGDSTVKKAAGPEAVPDLMSAPDTRRTTEEPTIVKEPPKEEPTPTPTRIVPDTRRALEAWTTNRPPTARLAVWPKVEKNRIAGIANTRYTTRGDETVVITAWGHDPDGDPLTYEFSVTGPAGFVKLTHRSIAITTKAPVGSYVVKCVVKDGRKGKVEIAETIYLRSQRSQ
jgi:hypothetical protein